MDFLITIIYINIFSIDNYYMWKKVQYIAWNEE